MRYAYKYLARITHNRESRVRDGVDVAALGNIPATPHQSRGGKKLLSMTEVNERFPLLMEKNWITARASGGLSTNSYDGLILGTEYVKDYTEDDDAGEQYPSSIPTVELFAEPYDSCAICISTLGHGNGIRSLTCGHVFHAMCLDPWLTLRRACCPLCKLDLYIPKSNAAGSKHAEQGGTIL